MASCVEANASASPNPLLRPSSSGYGPALGRDLFLPLQSSIRFSPTRVSEDEIVSSVAKSEMLLDMVHATFQCLAEAHDRARADLCQSIERSFAVAQRPRSRGCCLSAGRPPEVLLAQNDVAGPALVPVSLWPCTPQQDRCFPLSESLQKLLPNCSSPGLDVIATWLNKNFDIWCYKDLEQTHKWPKSVLPTIANDTNLSDDERKCLEELHARFTSNTNSSEPIVTINEYTDSFLRCDQDARPPLDIDMVERGNVDSDSVEPHTHASTATNVDIAEAVSEKTAVQMVQTTASLIELSHDERILHHISKLLPKYTLDALRPAIVWLREKFGICSTIDLECDSSWAPYGLSVVATDSNISTETKSILQDLLEKLAPAEAKQTFSCLSLNSTNGSQNQLELEDDVLTTLQKMFPESTPNILESAASWLTSKFGIAIYADIQDNAVRRLFAETGMSIVESDMSLGCETKEILRGLSHRLAESREQSSREFVASPGKPKTREELIVESIRNGEYSVKELLGSGNFASVHRIIEKSSHVHFALKEITNLSAQGAAFQEQVRQEVHIHRYLDHPHVLRCHDSFEKSCHVFLVLDVAEGGDLYKYLLQERRLKEVEAARIFSEVASGVHYLHLMEVMHRDLKLENILLDKDKHAKIADFGWCCRSTSKQNTECGSLTYMAPEVVNGDAYDHHVDTWALGILLYEMLAGYSPFASAVTEKETRERISKVDFDYGAWFDVSSVAKPLLQALLRKEAKERPTLPDLFANEWIVSHIGVNPQEAASALELRFERGEVRAVGK